MLFKNSRFSSIPAYYRDGNLVFESRDRMPFSKALAMLYMWVEGDTYDKLARRFYDDPQLWWAIADANPNVPSYTPMIAPGTRVYIPNYIDIQNYLEE